MAIFEAPEEVAMKKAVIFGAGLLGGYLFDKLKYTHEIVAFVSNEAQSNQKNAEVRTITPEKLPELEFDIVFIANYNALEDIYDQLVNDIKVPSSKICRSWSEMWAPGKMECYEPMFEIRTKWLETYAFWVYCHNIQGNCAEVGVYKGVFAKDINRLFFDRELYLFDTFEGFPEIDLQKDRELNRSFQTVDEAFRKRKYLSDTTIDLVLSKLPFPNLVSIKKGYFPDTFDLINEQFVFVNIDTDLYSSTKAGLEIFYPLMVTGGVILVHDYFTGLAGVTQAVDEFCANHKITPVPNGDYFSVSIIKNDGLYGG